MKEARVGNPIRDMTWTRRILLSLLATVFTAIVYGLMLFGISGRFDLPVYWAYLAIAAVVSLVGFTVIDPDLMRMELAEVQIQGDQAMVLVRFSSSQAPEGLEFEYELERSGEGWKVASSRSQGTHGGGTMPDDHPPDGLEAPDGTP